MKAINLYNYDCLDLLDSIGDDVFDLVLADPPYAKTSCGWDTIIPFEPLWQQLKRVTKKDGAIIMTAAQPFTSQLIMSNLKHFKQELIWVKNKGSNPLLAKKRIMQAHENIVVFCYGSLPYYPQMREGEPYKAPRTGGNRTNSIVGMSEDKDGFRQQDNPGFRYPLSWLEFNMHCGSKLHPTEKPVALMEYLIHTYSQEGDLVLDFAMGSGTTGVACINTNRSFVGIDNNKEIFDKAVKRFPEDVNVYRP